MKAQIQTKKDTQKETKTGLRVNLSTRKDFTKLLDKLNKKRDEFGKVKSIWSSDIC